MKSYSRERWLSGLGIFAFVLILAASAFAGPPLICQAIKIGSAQSLPWTSGSWNLTGREAYDLNHLVPDTLALLNPATPVLVRMETLRRATLYAQGTPQVARQLLLRLQARTAANDRDALAAFDFGYLVECYRQAGVAARYGMLRTTVNDSIAGVDGYAWVKKAISIRGDDPTMEFAAALITTEVAQQDRPEHLKKAIDGSKSDALLAENLASHFGHETLYQKLAKPMS
jgi:hypothetical protein